jgi:hypothetical protein
MLAPLRRPFTYCGLEFSLQKPTHICRLLESFKRLTATAKNHGASTSPISCPKASFGYSFTADPVKRKSTFGLDTREGFSLAVLVRVEAERRATEDCRTT